MSGILKGGWHPKGKDGKSKESWRGDFKGVDQVAGWMGKGKSKEADEAARNHVARPIASLKDPSSFAPPPKHINYHGAAAAPNTLTPDRSGLGRPLTAAEIRAQKEAEYEEARRQEEEELAAQAPPAPWRTDTTGLRTDHLPPPPGRVDSANGKRPPPPLPAKKAKPPLPGAGPSLPPRLPPRQNSNPDAYTPDPPPTYTAVVEEPSAHRGFLNQGSLSRLGAAGVSVPGFGIGKKPAPPPTPSRTNSSASSVAPPPSSGSQLNELQARFSRMNTSSPVASSPKSPPAQGTSFAEKQAAIRTAQSFKKDPSSVSLSDARTAASTANNFRERHGEQVASGVKTGNEMNQKYGIGNKIGGFASKAGYAIPGAAVQEQPGFGKKGPAPPPPAKKQAGSAVVELNPSNFDRVVMQSGTPAFVEFYAPYCKYCKEIITAWEELAQTFKNEKITIAKVDANQEKALGQRFGIASYPTLLYFDGYNEEPEKYQWQRNLERFSQFVTEKTGATGTPITTAGTGTPPPVPLASKPPVPLASKPRFGTPPPPPSARPTSTKAQPQPDLDLSSGWYAQSPPAFPPEALKRTIGKLAGWSMSTSFSSSGGRETRTLFIAMRCNGLSILKIKVSWDLADPLRSVQGDSKYMPEPRTLSDAELEMYRERYGDRVARWTESRRGTKVGNGECWTLSNDALVAVGQECEAQGIEPCMPSQSLVHGALVYEFRPPLPPSPAGGIPASLVARGDTIQFLSCEFHYPGGGKGYCGMPDHTAVVTGVHPDGVLDALHQNTGGKKIVMDTTFDFSKLVKGEVRIFRPVGKSWAGALDATW